MQRRGKACPTPNECTRYWEKPRVDKISAVTGPPRPKDLAKPELVPLFAVRVLATFRIFGPGTLMRSQASCCS